MRKFRRENDFACRVVYDGYASGFAPWIDLDSERVYLWLLNGNLENDCEGLDKVTGRFSANNTELTLVPLFNCLP